MEEFGGKHTFETIYELFDLACHGEQEEARFNPSRMVRIERLIVFIPRNFSGSHDATAGAIGVSWFTQLLDMM